MMTSDALQFYARHDSLTDPAGFARLYDELPAALPALCDVLSGLIVHTSWAAKYGIPPETPLPRDTKPVAERLAEVARLFDGPLVTERPPLRRPFGTCRDFALLLCSTLRHRGIPARVRCGFATYFAGRRYADHWICEYWQGDEGRWAMADAQIDRLQRASLGIGFDCAKLPNGAFLTAPAAWRLARSQVADAEEFGHGDAGGLWFLHVNLHRDLLALANCQVSAWDTWRDADEAGKSLSVETLSACDRLADLVIDSDTSVDWPELRPIADGVRMPPWQRRSVEREPARAPAN
ncbi:transglutaminase domain-containing protein [Hyphomicrobium sp. CS1BSMeth3]|uniref:transglutaminase domain-containing protein n=1 Tax=Hyphomicrobium sp. CS1BSMeth3 TaxID=1892844 RepID=UPI000931E724|nr:transglutaminase domain-containing protein [Hyphomicrobium sp. CS1BSMeth3]